MMWCWVQATLIVLGGVVVVALFSSGIAFGVTMMDKHGLCGPLMIALRYIVTLALVVAFVAGLVFIVTKVHSGLPCAS